MRPQSTETQQARSRAHRLLPVGAVLLVLGFAIFRNASTAHAGLGSFLAGLIGNQEASAETTAASGAVDSQISRAIVLQAAANPLLAQASAAADIPPIDGDTALSEEIAKQNATIVEPVNTQISTYVVRDGDTLSGVAKMFNVSVNTILWANGLTGRSTLHTGDTLVILPVTGITYTVKKGDTLQGIAKSFKADVGDIIAYNDLSGSSGLTAGDEIIIPSAELSTPPVAASRPSSSGSTAWLACPVQGAHVSQGIHGHNGVDLAIAVGTPIRASAAGTVIVSRSNGAWNGAYGNFVVILHPNGTQTLYAHMERAVVQSGARVAQGEVIGYVGMTGLTTGPHLHFEVRGSANPFYLPSRCR